MKTAHLILVLFSLMSSILLAHEQPQHQYITREAYNLLKLSYPELANSEMETFIGTNETVNTNNPWSLSWGAGKIVSGAWIEDEYDIVYHYGIGEEPLTNDDFGQILLDIFGSEREAYTSITHFWDSDPISGRDPSGIFNTTGLADNSDYGYWDMFCENAMQKMYKYSTGEYLNRWTYNTVRAWQNCSPPFLCTALDMSMADLFDLYFIDETMKAKNFRGEDLHWYSANDCPEFSSGAKSWIYENLGRMCHLLEDMSIPAHVHNDAHACTAGMSCEYYENNASSFHQWTASELYNSNQHFIFPFNDWGDPLYYLMYFMNQVTDHYASYGTDGDDNYDVSCPGLNIIPTLGAPTLSSQINSTTASQMHDVLQPLAIRATAGLLYWFAVNTNQLGITFSVNHSLRTASWNSGNKSFRVTNNSSNTVLLQIEDNQSWVTLSTDEVIIPAGQTTTITASYPQNSTSLQRKCNITFKDQFGLEISASLIQYEMPTLSGTLIKNETWTGNITLTDDVTVPSDKILTILPGTIINFPDYVELYVSGKLNAVGTSDNKIVFQSQSQISANSKNAFLIRLNDSNISRMEECIIQYAYRGIYVNNSPLNINNCEIKYCSYGIFNKNSNTSIHNNSITSCSYGIYNYFSNCFVTSNTINSCNYGIYNYYSSPSIKDTEIVNSNTAIKLNDPLFFMYSQKTAGSIAQY